MKRVHGFTLIEVLVALFIVAIGMSAVMTAITSAADTTSYLRDKSFAQWVGLNRIAELRLNAAGVAVGKSKGEVEFAGQKWRWRQEVQTLANQGMVRIDVGVQLATQKAPADSSDVDTDALVVVVGFRGNSTGRPSGSTPDWGGTQIGGPPTGPNPNSNPAPAPVPQP